MAIYKRLDKMDGKRRYELLSPVTLEPIGELNCCSKEEVEGAVDKARKAQRDWALRSIKERVQFIHNMIDEVLGNQDEIIETVMRETGKPEAEAMSMEVYASVDSLAFYSKRASKFLQPQKIKLHGPMRFLKKAHLIYKPRGVIAVITPWNGPFILSLNPTIQALLGGNAVIIKPSEVTPFSVKLVETLFLKAGLPRNLVQVLLGDGQTGEELVNSKIDKVSFTGSIKTGKKIAQICGSRLIPYTLELGGNDAMLVCSDADIDKAVDGALIGSCMNTGQYCCGTERIYVNQKIYDEFLKKVVEKAKTLKQSGQSDADIGATFWDKQLEVIEDHVNDAIEKGANLHLGGRRNSNLKGLFYEPTVLSNVNHEMKIMNEETFGPVVCIQEVTDDDEAIRLANDSRYGLNGNVWTKDKKKGLRIASYMETGAASVNDMAISYGINEVPFGGVKNSGIGFVNGKEGLRGYCHAMPIIMERFSKGPISSYPYRKQDIENMRGFLSLMKNKYLRKFLG
ncbi:MAG: aldehyde dehydrogenase family protein [SAR86 cluster bacterium]|nr:aldehyde dehydrogenase family protein [SAR86 cluster bacterium]